METKRTPNCKIKGMLRQMFLKSVERNECLKRDNYTCQKCKRKQTTKKGQEIRVQVHHINGISKWDIIIELIKQEIICDINNLQTLCEECHNETK